MKYELTQNSMRLRDVEVQFGFASGNLFVNIFYKADSRYGITATLGGNGDGREIMVLLSQDQPEGPSKGAFFRLYLTPKEHAASNGPGWVRNCDYCDTQLHFCPSVTEDEHNKSRSAAKIKDGKRK